MKIRVIETEVPAFLLPDEPDEGIELEMPDDFRQRWEDAWSLWSDVNDELRRRYQSVLSRQTLHFEIEGDKVREVGDQQHMEP